MSLPSSSIAVTAAASKSSSITRAVTWGVTAVIAAFGLFKAYSIYRRSRLGNCALCSSSSPSSCVHPLCPNSGNQLLQLTQPLRHTYIMVRHGESTANVDGIISSDPAISTVTHGLTEAGRKQVAHELAEWQKVLLPPNQPIVIVSSDFTRARETAEVIHHRLRIRQDVLIDIRLRERFFGDLNGGSNSGYELVWKEDVRSIQHQEYGVETVQNVVKRATQLIVDIETNLAGMIARASPTESESESSTTPHHAMPPTTVILVSHGDVCQILACAFKNINPAYHRSLEHWRNAEARQYIWPPHPSIPAPVQ